MLKLMGKRIFIILGSKILFNLNQWVCVLDTLAWGFMRGICPYDISKYFDFVPNKCNYSNIYTPINIYQVIPWSDLLNELEKR